MTDQQTNPNVTEWITTKEAAGGDHRRGRRQLQDVSWEV
jgi:hypothetical protein